VDQAFFEVEPNISFMFSLESNKRLGDSDYIAADSAPPAVSVPPAIIILLALISTPTAVVPCPLISRIVRVLPVIVVMMVIFFHR